MTDKFDSMKYLKIIYILPLAMLLLSKSLIANEKIALYEIDYTYGESYPNYSGQQYKIKKYKCLTKLEWKQIGRGVKRILNAYNFFQEQFQFHIYKKNTLRNVNIIKKFYGKNANETCEKHADIKNKENIRYCYGEYYYVSDSIKIRNRSCIKINGSFPNHFCNSRPFYVDHPHSRKHYDSKADILELIYQTEVDISKFDCKKESHKKLHECEAIKWCRNQKLKDISEKVDLTKMQQDFKPCEKLKNNKSSFVPIEKLYTEIQDIFKNI